MKFHKKLLLAGLIAPAFAAATTQAAEPGFYIGASGGQTTLEASTEGLNVGNGQIREFHIDDEETGYKGYLGYRFLPWLAVKGGYVELGEVSKDL